MRRMILLAHGRTGSELLSMALRQHPAIELHGELFIANDRDRERSPVAGKCWHPDDDGASFLRDVVYVDRGRAVVGFKMFLTHARTGPGASAWDYLAADREIDVVRLTRANLLEVFTSIHAANHAQTWHVPAGGAAPEVAPFSVEPEQAAHFFRRISAFNQEADERFVRHRTVSLEYARDLVGDFDRTLERVFALLGVDPIPVTRAFVKQAQRPPSQQIANWDQLVAFFAGSEWARWFT